MGNSAGTELWRRGSNDLAGLIASGEVTSTEVVEAHLDRIEAVNRHLNAITTLLADSAQAAASDADRAVAAGRPLGPLHGVPITVKQNIDLVGSATNQGLAALAEALPTVDSPVTERMRAAGAIPIGRTNCPDLGLRVHTDSALFGLTRNPWHPGRTASGSSGGEAAALATDMSPLGLGNDIGGSLRNPANACGIASIKPTHGLVPFCTTFPAPDAGFAVQLMLCEGPMARTIGDVRSALAILAGRHPRDPYSVPAPPPTLRPTHRPWRVVVLPEPPGGSTDPRIAAQVRRAADALDAAGYDVVEGAPPRYTDVSTNWLQFIGCDRDVVRPLLDVVLSADTRAFLDSVQTKLPPADVNFCLQMAMTRQALMREWAVWFSDNDLLLTPTWTQFPFEHGFDIGSVENALAVIEMIRPVVAGNVLGIPSTCVPTGVVDGLPVNVLVHADRFRDDITLDAAEIIEAATGSITPIDPVLEAILTATTTPAHAARAP